MGEEMGGGGTFADVYGTGIEYLTVLAADLAAVVTRLPPSTLGEEEAAVGVV
jgi:hypothetical protein